MIERLRRRTSSGRYIPEVDGIRFIAIMLVLVFHATISILAPVRGAGYHQLPFGTNIISFKFREWDWILAQGRYGVHLFFILSGFILGLPFVARRPSLRAYFKRRVTRLEPPYLVALSICFLLAPSAMGVHYLVGLIYTHTQILNSLNPLNGAYWSLEVEIQFYILLPLLASVFLVPNKIHRRLLLITGIIVGQIINVLGAFNFRFEYSVIGFAGLFFTGMLLADVYVCDWHNAPSMRPIWDMFGGAAAVAFLLGHGKPVFDFLLPGIGIILFVAALRGPLTSAALSNRYVTTIGGMAYSIYLLHVPVMVLLSRVVPQNVFVFATTLIAASLAAGLAFFISVERPCMDPLWPVKVIARVRRQSLRPAEDSAVDRVPVGS